MIDWSIKDSYIVHRTREKVIPISSSDDKRQITAVFAASLTGDFLAPQIIYKGRQSTHTQSFCAQWLGSLAQWQPLVKRRGHEALCRKDHCSMSWCKRAALQLSKSHPALAIFDCFRGQTTPEFLSLLEEHNIVCVQVPANCTNRLQPLDVSINKPIKDDLKKSFHSWHANEMQKQLQSVPVHKVEVDVSAAVIKAKNVSWFISA